jgi:hypothetical protein
LPFLFTLLLFDLFSTSDNNSQFTAAILMISLHSSITLFMTSLFLKYYFLIQR